MFENRIVVITGGTGSFGSTFCKSNYLKNAKEIRIFSRDEKKQDDLRSELIKRKNVSYFIGDTRDYDSVENAFNGADYVFHAAALKQVPSCEFFPLEAVKTNILGSENVINAALETNVKKVIALSTDKASSPANLYGATKLCSDKLFMAANNIKGFKTISFSILRYGNVFGSRGSIYNIIKNNPKIIKMTDDKMTRFHINMNKAIELCLWAIEKSIGGEIIVPKIPSYKLTDFIKSISPNSKVIKVGIRPGEKIHEEMISINDSPNTIELKDKFLICNEMFKEKIIKHYSKQTKVRKVHANFCYSSDDNNFLTSKELKKIHNQAISDKKRFL